MLDVVRCFTWLFIFSFIMKIYKLLNCVRNKQHNKLSTTSKTKSQTGVNQLFSWFQITNDVFFEYCQVKDSPIKCQILPVICHLPNVTLQMSPVICHLPCITCHHLSYFTFIHLLHFWIPYISFLCQHLTL